MSDNFIVDQIPINLIKSLYIDSESFKGEARIVIITSIHIYTTKRIDRFYGGYIYGEFKRIIKV